MVIKCGHCKERIYDETQIQKCPKCKKDYCSFCISSTLRKPGITDVFCPHKHLIRSKYIDPGSRREISKEEFEQKMGYS